MLQQTQVSKVIPYYQRFILRFPNVQSLSVAHSDEVMHLWSGLGYYSRAINLHKSARIICKDFQGKFPEKYDDLIKLPGIGPSTAGAVLSLAGKQRHVVLDTNLKRVLARYLGNKEDLTQSKAHNKLWQQAQSMLPSSNVDIYNQGLMDLGASICSIKQPQCSECPLKSGCLAFSYNWQTEIPVKKKNKVKPFKKANFMLLFDGEHVLLKKRPSTGVWANLWALPEYKELSNQIWQWMEYDTWPIRRTTFSHYHLDFTITPAQVLQFEHPNDGWLWYNLSSPAAIGLAAPISTVLQDFSSKTSLSMVAEKNNLEKYE